MNSIRKDVTIRYRQNVTPSINTRILVLRVQTGAKSSEKMRKKTAKKTFLAFLFNCLCYINSSFVFTDAFYEIFLP